MRLIGLAVAVVVLLLACASQTDGEWIYGGPLCPKAYENCRSWPTSPERMSLVPLGDWHPDPLFSPSMSISCWEGSPLLALSSSGEEIGESGAASLTVSSEGQGTAGVYRSTVVVDERSALFQPPVVNEILALLVEADSEGRKLDMAISGREQLEYRFNLSGTGRNLARLPCGAAFEDQFIVPTPLPASSVYGRWKYHGSECPEGYANCDIVDVSPYLSLHASRYSPNSPDQGAPSIQVTCQWTRPHFAFDAGGPLRGGGELRRKERAYTGESPFSEGPGDVTILLGPEGGEVITIQATTTGTGLVEFVPQSAREILALLDSTESRGQSVRLWVGPPNRAAAEFVLAGLRSYVTTLPCAQR